MLEVHLPMMIGNREQVAALLDAQQVPAAADRGDLFVIYCARLYRGSATAADELVRQAFVLRDAGELVLIGCGREFEGFIRAAAERRGAAERVYRRSAALLPV
jgi:hypothetical protein